MSERPEETKGFFRVTGASVVLFLFLGSVLFLAYRAAFLWSFTSGVPGKTAGKVLLYGLRLDLALLGMQAAAVLGVSVVLLNFRLRLVSVLFAVWLFFDALFALVALLFYSERNQHVGELLVSHLGQPDILAGELTNFLRANPVSALLLLVVSYGYYALAKRLILRVPPLRFSLWRKPWRFPALLAAAVVLGFAAREPVHTKKGSGRGLEWATSRHYSSFGNYLIHQAVQNPLHETVVAHLPRAFASPPPPRMALEDATRIIQENFPGRDWQEEFPLLTTVESDLDLEIENVLILVVEGLTASLLEQERDGLPVMPVLRGLSSTGIFFPNTIQGSNKTAGGIYCVTTGLPRTSVGEAHARLFAGWEISGYFGSLPRVLGGDRHSLFACGFRQSSNQYSAFMGNQGFQTVSYPDLHEILAKEGRDDGTESTLGVFDHVLFGEVARRVLADPRPYTIQVMTASTHSPWTTPSGHRSAFQERKLSAFHYLDWSVGRLIQALKLDEKRYRKTLVVVTGDHTSVTFGDTFMERQKIPLIFYSTGMESRGLSGRRETMAGHIDVVPTVLGLMGGSHRFAGLGRNLMADDLLPGVIGSDGRYGLYFDGDLVLRWLPENEILRLNEIRDGNLVLENLAEKRPEVFEDMKRQYFSRYEAARSLTIDKRVFPRDDPRK